MGHMISESNFKTKTRAVRCFADALVKVVAPQPMTSAVPDECFQPFVLDGFVSLTGRVED